MMRNQQERTKNFELYRTLDQAQIHSREVKERSIVLLGLSRAGKSTVMNWITAPQSMVGCRMGTNFFYVPANSHIPRNPEEAWKMAKIGNTFASVTVEANMRNLLIDNLQISFLDFGGFGQRRQPLEIIKVNYVLATYLLQISKVKFILVVTEKAFSDISSNGLRDTLQEFLKLFDFNTMNQQQTEELLNSVSLCITSVPRNFSQDIIVEQLEIIIRNFEDPSLLNEYGQNTYIQKYSVCKRLLTKWVNTRRFELFPLAEEGQQPNKSAMMAKLNKRQWSYFNLQNCREHITYPYVQQFLSLKEQQRQNIVQIINSKFDYLEQTNAIIKRVIEKIFNQICSKGYNFEEDFADLQKLLAQNTYYEELATLVPDQRMVPSRVTWLQRQQHLTRMHQICCSYYQYSHWLAEQTQQQSNSVRMIQYYKCLERHFKEQARLLQPLLCSTPRQRLILNQIIFIAEKAFNEGLTYQKLNHNLDRTQCNLSSDLTLRVFQNSQLGNEFTFQRELIKLKFVQQLYSREIGERELTLAQAHQLLVQMTRWQSEVPEIDSAHIYCICSRLYLIVGQELTAIQANPRKILSALLEGLQLCIKQQICLESIKSESGAKMLIGNQRAYMSKVVRILLQLYTQESLNIGFQMCKVLKQHSRTEQMYSFIMERQPGNLELLGRFAQFAKSIGRGDRAIQLYQRMAKMSGINQSLQISEIANQAIKNYQIAIQHQEDQKNYIFPKETLLTFISLIQRRILQQNSDIRINFEKERERYERRMQHIIRERSYQRSFPTKPSNYQILKHSNQLIQLLKGPSSERAQLRQQMGQEMGVAGGKRITLVVSQSKRSGKTTLAYALSGKHLAIKQGSPNYYDLLDKNCQNRINHGSNPTEYPHFLPANDHELIVDFINLFSEGVQKKLIGSLLLEQCIRSSSGFRFMFVMRDQALLSNNGLQMVHFFKLLLSLFDLDFSQPQNCKGLSRLIYVAVTSVSNGAETDKKLQNISKGLVDKQKAVENEQMYSLNAQEQLAVHNILQNIIKNARLLLFPVPNLQDKFFHKNNWLAELQADTTMSHHWHYSSPEITLLNLTTNMLNKVLLQTELITIIGSINHKITFLSSLFGEMMDLAEHHYRCQLDRNNSPATHHFNKLDSICGSVPQQSQREQVGQTMQQGSHSQELLVSVYYLYRIKYYFIGKSRQYYLPDDYPAYFEMLQGFTSLLSQYLATCCRNATQHHVIQHCSYSISTLLYELLQYSQTIGNCTREELRGSLNQIRTVGNALEAKAGQEYIEELQRVFFGRVNLQDITSDSPERRERSMEYYGQILQIIEQNLDREAVLEHISIEEWVALKQQFNEGLVEVYKKLKRKRQLLDLRLRMVKQLCSKGYVLAENRSVQQQSRQRLQQITDIFSHIAREIVISNPKLSIHICIFTGAKTTLAYIYEVIYQNQRQHAQRLKLMLQRIDLAYQLQPNTIYTPNALLSQLKTTLNRANPLFRQLSTVEGVVDYVAKNGLREIPESQPPLSIDRVKNYIEQIGQQLK